MIPVHFVRRAILVSAAVSGLLGVVYAIADAHAVVYPKATAPGSYERYVLRVPNEKNSATTKVELRFPAGLRVTSFSDVPGWQLEIMTDSAGAITGAIWTGTLPPKRFIEFPFVAANPKTEATLVWPAFQTYADGERVEWTGPEGSKRPASATEVRSLGTTGGAGPSRVTTWVAFAALLLALISLGLSVRRTQPAV